MQHKICYFDLPYFLKGIGIDSFKNHTTGTTLYGCYTMFWTSFRSSTVNNSVIRCCSVALYSTHWVRHSPFNVLFGFDLQLHFLLLLFLSIVMLSSLKYVVWWFFRHWWYNNNSPFECLSWKSYGICCSWEVISHNFDEQFSNICFLIWIYDGLNHIIIFLFLFLGVFGVLLLLKDIDRKMSTIF